VSSIIVLAMHGAPPNDFPRLEAAEFFALHGRIAHGAGAQQPEAAERYEELHAKMRAWPRTAANDPFYQASMEMADHLAREAGQDVVVGFGEFCGPSLDDALDLAAATGATSITVTTPMMTRGGEHAEQDIPAAIDRAKVRHPSLSIHYNWPFDMAEIARFLAGQVQKSDET
jgi:sirohydrochlorin cobaltochelatase